MLGHHNKIKYIDRKRAIDAFRWRFNPERKSLYIFHRVKKKRTVRKSPQWAINAQKRFYQKHRDEILKKIREKRALEKEKIREYQKDWNRRNRNRTLEKYHRYYQKHRDKAIAYRKKYYEEHR